MKWYQMLLVYLCFVVLWSAVGQGAWPERDSFGVGRLRKKPRGYGPSSTGVPVSSPPAYIPPPESTVCYKTCAISLDRLGLVYGLCEGRRNTETAPCEDGILLENPSKGCGGNYCDCCIQGSRNIPSPSPENAIALSPEPPGGSCTKKQCYKSIEGLGIGFGKCLAGASAEVCKDKGGIEIPSAKGCGDSCQCCILDARLNTSSPPMSPSPFPPQPGTCTERLCRQMLADGTYGFGFCEPGNGLDVCQNAGSLPAGSDAEGCNGGDCQCCLGTAPPPVSVPSPPPPGPDSPPTSVPSSPAPPSTKECRTDTLCGVQNSDSSVTYGRCVVGNVKNADAECDARGGVYLGPSSVGCSTTNDCFCCGPKKTSAPPMPSYSPPVPASCDSLCGVRTKNGAVIYGKCVQGQDPVQTCLKAGGDYAGDESIGCSDGCACCLPDNFVVEPYPTPPPPTEVSVVCDDRACGFKTKDGKTVLGKCVTGSKDPDKTCEDNGFAYAGAQSIGCDESSQNCHCCVEKSTMAPPSPVSPPPQVPLQSPPPPPTCPASCFVELNGQEFQGTCRPGDFTDYQSAVAECASIDGVPVRGACGEQSCGICCLDSSMLCGSSSTDGCACKCILTSTGGSCNKPLYPDYNPPPGNGGGCQENTCNAFAVKEDVSAGCCPFGC